MNRRFLLNVVLLLTVAAMLLSACGPAETPVPEEPTTVEEPAPTEPSGEGEEPTEEPSEEPTEEPVEEPAEEPTEFVFAHPGPIATLDAPVTWYLRTHWVANLMYDCLIWRNADGSGYHGQAAERWENVDPTTWRFHLRPGLTFHNGEPLDAEAVKWNIDRVRTREDFMVQPQWEFVKEVNVLDELTLEITTNEPVAYFEYYVSYNGCELQPPQYMEEVGEEEYAKSPVGSGPYELVEFTPGERYVFEAWDGYWDDSPDVDRIVYQVIPEQASQVAALLAGQVDLIFNVPGPDVVRLEEAEGIVTMDGPANRATHLNLRRETESGSLAETYPDYEPTTLDKRIRHAISHALDRTTLAEIQGNASPTLVRVAKAWPESHAEKFAGEEAADAWYDPELARELIIEAGYDPEGGDKPRVYFDSPAYEFGNEKEVAEAAAAMLEDVGFEVELNVLESSAYLEQIHQPGNNRDIMLVSLGASPSLTPLFFTCDWWDLYYHVCVEEWSELGQEIMRTIDIDDRLGLWEEWWEYYLDEVVYATMYEMNYTYAIDENFRWTPRADAWMTFRDVEVVE